MVGKIVNHVPDLLAKSGKTHMDMVYDMRIAFDTAADWAQLNDRQAPKSVSQEIMAKLCDFFGVQPGEIWEYVPE